MIIKRIDPNNVTVNPISLMKSFNPSLINTDSIVNVTAIKDILSVASSRLIDINMNSDSNGLYQQYGWQHGFQQGMRMAGLTMYGSGIQGFGENKGGGAGVGFAAGTTNEKIGFRSGGGNNGMAAEKNIPTSLLTYFNSYNDPNTPSNNHLMPSIWLSTSDPASNEAQINGLKVGLNNPLGNGTNMKYQMWAAKFSNTSYNPTAYGEWRQLNGGNNVIFTDYSCSDAGVTRVPTIPVEYTLQAQTGNYEVRRQDPSTPTNTDAYPFACYFQRLIRTDITEGFAVHAGYAVGGATSEDAFNYWTAMGTDALANYLQAVTYEQTTQGYAPYLLVTFSYGINDVPAGTTTANFKLYMQGLISLYKTAWSSLGLGGKLRFALAVTPPTIDGDSNLSGFRLVCDEIATLDPHVASINMNSITSFTELNTVGIPQHAEIGVNIAHLLTSAWDNDSYSTLWSRVADDVLTYDSDVKSYFDAVEDTGASLSVDDKIAMNTFVLGLKSSGVWDKIDDAAIFMGSSTLAGALVKLKGTTSITNNNFVGSDYDAAVGLTGNGSDKTIDTGVLANSLEVDNHHVAVWTPTVGTTSRYVAGSNGFGGDVLSFGTDDFTRDANSTAATVSLSDDTLNILNRGSETEFSIWVGETENVQALASTTSLPSENIYLYCRLISGSPNSLNNGSISYYSLGSGLTDSEIETYNTLVSNLVGSLS